MAKYDYSTNVIPVFIERKEEEIDAFAHNGLRKQEMLMVKT